MKKKELTLIILFLIFLTPLLTGATPPYTITPTGNSVQTVIYNALTQGLIKWLFAFLVVGSLIGILIGSFIITTSGGDSGKLATGRKTIIISLVAVFIGSFAWTLVTWANSMFSFP